MAALLVCSSAILPRRLGPLRRSGAASRTSSGGVLPGATVTMTNTGTKAVRTRPSPTTVVGYLARGIVRWHVRHEGRAVQGGTGAEQKEHLNQPE